MDKTPWESAQKPLVLALWGSRFVDLNLHRRNDEPARHFLGSILCALLDRPFWPHNGHTYPPCPPERPTGHQEQLQRDQKRCGLNHRAIAPISARHVCVVCGPRHAHTIIVTRLGAAHRPGLTSRHHRSSASCSRCMAHLWQY